MWRFLSRNYKLKEVSIALLMLALAALFVKWRADVGELKKARLAYENPRTETVARVEEKKGAVKTVRREVKTPDGTVTKTETIEEAPVERTVEAVAISEPVMLAAARTDRWLLGAQLDKFAPRSRENWSVLAGYSLKNRVDLVAGGHVHGDLDPFVQVLFRF